MRPLARWSAGEGGGGAKATAPPSCATLRRSSAESEAACACNCCSGLRVPVFQGLNDFCTRAELIRRVAALQLIKACNQRRIVFRFDPRKTLQRRICTVRADLCKITLCGYLNRIKSNRSARRSNANSAKVCQAADCLGVSLPAGLQRTHNILAQRRACRLWHIGPL